MAREITAPRTRANIGWARTELGDESFLIFKTQDELFTKANDCVEEICRETFCLDSTIDFDIIPDQWEYDLIDVVDTPQYILTVNEVSVLDADDNESDPLIKLTPELFKKYRRDTSISLPQYYDFDGNKIFIWKPYDVTGYRVRVRCSRLPHSGEQMSYAVDPVIAFRYDKFLKYGIVAKAIMAKPELGQKFNVEYYLAEFNKYKSAYRKPRTTDNEQQEFNELHT